MPREDWRDREDTRRRRWSADPRDREDFGQADYSEDYAYDPRHRSGYRAEEDIHPRTDDYGQADYTSDWAYDPERGRPYRRYADDRGPAHERHEPSRSWRDRAGDFFAGRPHHDEDRSEAHRHEDDRDVRRRRRDGPSDRVLWAVIMERLDHERRLDLRDVEVDVRDGEVTLNGTMRRKADKRRIEDIADIDGVRNVQNNLRVRDSERHWTLI